MLKIRICQGNSTAPAPSCSAPLSLSLPLFLSYFGKSLRRLVLPLILPVPAACLKAAFPVTNTSQSTKLVGCLVGWLVGCLTSLHFASLAYNATALSQRHFESSRAGGGGGAGVGELVDGDGVWRGAFYLSPCLADDLSAL